MVETLNHMVFFDDVKPRVKVIPGSWRHDQGITFTRGLTSSKKPYGSRSQPLKFMVNCMVGQG